MNAGEAAKKGFEKMPEAFKQHSRLTGHNVGFKMTAAPVPMKGFLLKIFKSAGRHWRTSDYACRDCDFK